MFKRFLCLMAAIMVASSSAMAWTAESFIGNDYDQQETYDFEPVSDVPMRFMSMRSTASSSDSLYSIPLGNPTSRYTYDDLSPFYLFGSATMNANGIMVSIPIVGFAAPLVFGGPSSGSGGYTWWVGQNQNNPYSFDVSEWDPNDDESRGWFDGWDYFGYNDIIFDYDVSVPSGSYGVSFSPDVWAYAAYGVSSGSTIYGNVVVDYFVNGQLVSSESSLSLNDHIDREFTYTYTQPISSVSVRLTFKGIQSQIGLPSSSTLVGSGTFRMMQVVRENSYIDVGFLDGLGGLNVHNDDAQSMINDHNAIESEWTGSMTSNFNALSIETFSFPSGLVSAFGLITGIFNDLWNGMGEYKIAYVFPLTLGVALLLIGRISKFAGGQSSGKRNRGDDGA